MFVNEVFTASTTRITSTGSCLALITLKALIGCATLLSMTVKSDCARFATGGPDFGVTTTSRRISGVVELRGVGICCAELHPAAATAKTTRVANFRMFDMDWIGINSLRPGKGFIAFAGAPAGKTEIL